MGKRNTETRINEAGDKLMENHYAIEGDKVYDTESGEIICELKDLEVATDAIME